MRGCGDGRVSLFWVADVVVATNSLVVIIAVFASVFTSRRAAASCSCPPRLVVILPLVNLRLRNHRLPSPPPSMVGCCV
jgi:hypothetical protein